MPARTDVAAEFATAVAHPTRVRLLGALADGPRTGAALATALRTDARAVARHARPLVHLGLIEGSDAPPQHRVYSIVRDPTLSDDAWDRLPIPARRAAAAASLTQWLASAATAVDDGGFDRRDAHLSRTAFEFDEERWSRAAAILADTLGRLTELADAPVEQPTVRATAMMLLFDAPQDASAAERDEPHGEFSDAEGLERAIDLAESLQDAVTREATPWAELIALADELRVVARAAMVEQSRTAPPRAVKR